jgi:hypothetical protein
MEAGVPTFGHAKGQRVFKQTERVYSLTDGESPSAVGGAIGGGVVGGGVDVGDTRFLLVNRHEHVFLNHFPVGFAGHGIDRELAQITRGDQLVERLRGFLLVERVLRDDRAERCEIGSKNRFTCLNDGLVVDRDCYGHEDHHDADHDHELEQSEAARALATMKRPRFVPGL